MKWTIWDYISVSVIFLYIIPLIIYFNTNDIIHIKALLGLIGTTTISESIKRVIIKDNSPRPDGASNCNLLCNDGIQSGKPGMPSSHSAQVAFFTGFYIQYTQNIYVRIILIGYMIIVMFSRYIKYCHTFGQIIIGGIIGGFISYLMVRHL